MENEFETLRTASVARNKIWDPSGRRSACFKATELAGEVGEVCNIVKKLERNALGLIGSTSSAADLADELADVVICLDMLAEEYDIDLWPAIVQKFNATSKKVKIPVYITDVGEPE